MLLFQLFQLLLLLSLQIIGLRFLSLPCLGAHRRLPLGPESLPWARLWLRPGRSRGNCLEPGAGPELPAVLRLRDCLELGAGLKLRCALGLLVYLKLSAGLKLGSALGRLAGLRLEAGLKLGSALGLLAGLRLAHGRLRDCLKLGTGLGLRTALGRLVPWEGLPLGGLMTWPSLRPG